MRRRIGRLSHLWYLIRVTKTPLISLSLSISLSLFECDTCKLAMLLNKFAALGCFLVVTCVSDNDNDDGNVQRATCKIGLRCCVQIRLKRATTTATSTPVPARPVRASLGQAGNGNYEYKQTLRWLPRRQSAINLNDCQPMQQPTTRLLQHVAHLSLSLSLSFAAAW